MCVAGLDPWVISLRCLYCFVGVGVCLPILPRRPGRRMFGSMYLLLGQEIQIIRQHNHRSRFAGARGRGRRYRDLSFQVHTPGRQRHARHNHSLDESG